MFAFTSFNHGHGRSHAERTMGTGYVEQDIKISDFYRDSFEMEDLYASACTGSSEVMGVSGVGAVRALRENVLDKVAA